MWKQRKKSKSQIKVEVTVEVAGTIQEGENNTVKSRSNDWSKSYEKSTGKKYVATTFNLAVRVAQEQQVH